MGIKYGYCEEPIVTWKLEYSTGFIKVGEYGKMNVVLVKTERNIYPMWYARSGFEELRSWVDFIKCDLDSGYIPESASMGIQLVERYRWRPKDADPDKGEVINYNEPCNPRELAREGLRLNFNYALNGTGNIEYSKLIGSAEYVRKVLSDISSYSISTEWTMIGNQLDRPLNDWEKFSKQMRADAGSPAQNNLPKWTNIQLGISGLMNPNISSLEVTYTTLYPDKDPNTTPIHDVTDTLIGSANVTW